MQTWERTIYNKKQLFAKEIKKREQTSSIYFKEVHTCSPSKNIFSAAKNLPNNEKTEVSGNVYKN